MNNGNGLKVGYIAKMFPRLSETFVLNEILELERRGVEVVIFSVKKPNEGRFHPQLASLKAPVIYLEDLDTKKWANWVSAEWDTLSHHRTNLWKLVDETLAGKDVREIDNIWHGAWVAAKAKALQLDRLHAHFASLPSTIAHYANQITGIPYSFTAHAKDIFVYSMDDHLLRQKLSAANDVITVTHFNERYLTERAPEVEPGKIKVIHNGINLAQFAHKTEGREDDLILAVGRLVPKKGFDDLLSACALLKEKGQRFRCMIVGGGVDTEKLLQQRADLGLVDDVVMTGPKTHDEVLELMNRATVFCLPCTVASDNNQDALPTVLLEALACGLPAISTSVSGVPEIIDAGENGILVPANDPEAIANELIALLNSPATRERFANNGRQKAERSFDLSKSVGRLIDVFQGRDDAASSVPGTTNGGAKRDKSRLRVGYVCSDRGIPFGGTKGASVHVREFIDALQESGYEPTAVVARRAKNTTYNPSYPVHTPPADFATSFFDRLGRDGTAVGDTREFCRNQAVEQVLGNIHKQYSLDLIYERYSLFGTAGREFANRAGVPFVLEVNAPLVVEAPAYRQIGNLELANAIEHHLFSTADHVIAVSERLKEYILGIAHTANVTVLPNGVNMARFETAERSDAWREKLARDPQTDCLVGFIGRVRPWHGVDLLIDAFAAIAADIEAMTLCIVGDTGDQRLALEARCSELGIRDRVVFVGAVEPDDVPAILQSMDVLTAPYPVLPEFYFSPLKVFEYMAAAKPIVASAVGQINDVLENEETALLVEAGSVVQLATALRRVYSDRDLARRIGQNARLEAKRSHTWTKRLDSIASILGVHAHRIDHADTI